MMSLRSSGYVDPGWEYGVAQDDRKKKVKCNFCGKVVSGGIYRLKQHLARVSGEVTYCEKAPEEVCLKMKENLEGCRSSKKPRQAEDVEPTYLNYRGYDDRDEGDGYVGYKGKGKQLVGNRALVASLTPLRSLGYVDPGWEHGAAMDDRKKKVKCNYCEKIVSGGINRFKQHLARIPGEVAPCRSAPEEVYMKIKDNMKWHRTGRRHRRADVKEVASLYTQSDNEDEEEEKEEDAVLHMSKETLSLGDKRMAKELQKIYRGMSSSSGSESFFNRPRFDQKIVLRTSKNHTSPCYREGKVKVGSNRQSRKEVISAICKFFYHAGVPIHAANSLYFHKMLDLVGQYGPGLVGPPSQLMSARFLEEEIATIKYYQSEYRASWAITGCSVLADSWRDTQGRTLINFLVSCPRGVYYVSTVDVTDELEDDMSLFKLLDKLVEDMGEENVVQVITMNTPSFRAAGKMLEEKRRNLYWTPCATYSIDRMLKDFMKIKWVGECLEKGKRITRLIYNQSWLLNLMKNEFTAGQDLLRPTVTPFASSFATLQTILEHRVGLKRMFVSNKWNVSRTSKLDKGREVEKIVLNPTFWKKMQYVGKSVDPILQLLPKVGTVENLSMPYIYNDINMAKLAIKSIHGDDERKFGPFWKVINNHWDSSFQHPLYLAAYFLNPLYRYRADFMMNAEVTRGLNECISRLEPEKMRKISASMQIADYTSARADFGTELAVSTRTQLDPAAWWQQHGINCLELQRIAVRILSQTCSSFGCEHHWSIFDQVSGQRCNRLSQKKLNEFIYVHYNLRLRERQSKKWSLDLLSQDSLLLESLLDEWIVESEKKVLQEDEGTSYSEMEPEDVYENNLIEYEDGTLEAQKRSLEMVSLVDTEPLIVHTSDIGNVSDDDDDDDLDFLDGDFSE